MRGWRAEGNEANAIELNEIWKTRGTRDVDGGVGAEEEEDATSAPYGTTATQPDPRRSYLNGPGKTLSAYRDACTSSKSLDGCLSVYLSLWLVGWLAE